MKYEADVIGKEASSPTEDENERRDKISSRVGDAEMREAQSLWIGQSSRKYNARDIEREGIPGSPIHAKAPGLGSRDGKK